VRAIHNLPKDILRPLEGYADWVFSPAVQDALTTRMRWSPSRLLAEARPEAASAVETLMAMNHEAHAGFPPDLHGVDLNYLELKKHQDRVDPAFFAEIRAVNQRLDDQLQTYLGAKMCALKAFYPTNGYIAWHTNWGTPGYNILFTYSRTGNGHWRHIDAAGATSVTPRPDRLVHIEDVPGWHCKVGYFGAQAQVEQIVWHAAFTREPRLSVAYLVTDKAIYESLLDEIAGG
jgi:hypothetical protein